MSRAIISLTDESDGSFSTVVQYEGGFNKLSHAHQHTNILMEHLNTLAKQMEEPEVHTITDADVKPLSLVIVQ
jgi:hypothetical protein